MKLDRLNGWERLWIVATVLWLIYVGVLVSASLTGDGPFSHTTKGQTTTVVIPAKCSPNQAAEKSKEPTNAQEEFLDKLFEECPHGATVVAPSKRVFKTTPDKREYFFYQALFFALLPPLFLLLASHVTVRVTRWVVAGFKRRAT